MRTIHSLVSARNAPRSTLEPKPVRRRTPGRLSLVGVLPTVLFLASCVKDPVAWQDKTEMANQFPSPLTFPGKAPFDSVQSDTSQAAAFERTQDLLREAGAMSVLESVLNAMSEADSASSLRKWIPTGTDAQHVMPMAGHDAMLIPGGDLGAGESPRDAARCARSLRIVDAPGRGRVAVWWTRQDRGRVFLVAAWRWNAASADSSSSWRGPINVDTLDQGAGDANALERGAVGCDRAAPGVAVGPNGYVHVAYAMNAPEGPGVFYAHQMDPRSAFEPPVVMMYGDRRLGAARVATSRETVAVAFEDPNAPLNRGRIGLAISHTSGHLFEPRVTASRSGWAVDPYVLVRANAAVVGWTDVDSSISAASAFRMRRGTMR